MRLGRGLFVADPADEVFDGGLLAVHEDADAVDFGRNPYHGEEGDHQEHKREGYFPAGDAEGDARHHHHGRCEGYDREPEGEAGVGVVGHRHGEYESEYYGHDGY